MSSSPTLVKTAFLPSALQSPRIPIWVGGIWPNKAPFRRAARWDGAFPLKTGGAMRKKDLENIRAFIQQHRTCSARDKGLRPSSRAAMILAAPMLNILVIGGSGFLSGAIAWTALAQGHRVWTFTRGQRPVPAGAISLVADRADRAAFAQVVTNARTHWDLVVDCIGYVPADVAQDIAVLAPLAQHLVFVSTDFVYDPAHRHFPQSEDIDHYLTDGYGGQKRRCTAVTHN